MSIFFLVFESCNVGGTGSRQFCCNARIGTFCLHLVMQVHVTELPYW